MGGTILLSWSSLRTRDTRNYCSGAVTTCFNDLGLSRLGIEPRSPAIKANVLPTKVPRQYISQGKDKSKRIGGLAKIALVIFERAC